jgi:AmmeMemoRadiSam system protein B
MDSRKKSSPEPLSASLAGTCYPAEPAAILDHFRHFYDQPKGPVWPGKAKTINKAYLGVLAPHIDFRVSPVAYAHAFAPWFAAKPADSYLILGVGHHGHQEWSWDERDYITALGRIENDKAGLEILRKKVDLPPDPAAHDKEHSIEFPLICLQAWRQLRGIDKPFRFLPVLCGGLNAAVEAGQIPPGELVLSRLAGALREWIDQGKGSVQIIVSIDGCHVGPRFGHPFTVNREILEECRTWEETLWRRVETNNLDGFFTHLGENGNLLFFDGVGALALLMQMFGKRLALHRNHYEQWFQSKDGSVVTFSSGSLELLPAL